MASQESYQADLAAKIAARKGQPGYAKNVEALKAELARVQALAAAETQLDTPQ